MMRMNYMSDKLERTEENLNNINSYKLNSVYVIAHGASLQEALSRNDRLVEKGNEFLQQKRIRSFTSPGSLLLSDSIQQRRIDRWNAFWTDSRKKDFLYRFNQTASQTGFNINSFGSFHDLVSRDYTILEPHDFNQLQAHFFNEKIFVATA